MNKVIETELKPIKLWLDDIEQGALAQAKNLANLPFVFKHIAIMPDSHQGYGMPIGGVAATTDVIIPNAVGVDIGCGMCAVRTDLREIPREKLLKIITAIKTSVPVGFKKHPVAVHEKLMPEMPGLTDSIVVREANNASLSLGSLGGGNHFIEIQKGDDGYIWIMIHSGSRNLGKQVADHYNKIAMELNKKWWSVVPKEWELAFLPVDSPEGQNYITEMTYCVDFALANRKAMMEAIKESISAYVKTTFESMINIAHNYARLESHFGKNVWVHRKGATSAQEGETGIIPGSQGSSSYIVKGKGNIESFKSCSHGAGRTMGRKEAQRNLDLQSEINRLDNLGVIHNIRGITDLDEAAGAYKDIDRVMSNQSDLISVEVKLTPLAVIKG